jgi:uncharacterized protein YceH (UPF0502 family)
MAIQKAISGLTSIVGSAIGGRARRREERAANAEFQDMKMKYQGLDTTNLAANYQNTYEDLAVNTQQAEFTANQQQQVYGDTMDKLAQGAGGSGIAALAQAMEGQQSRNMQLASASIGAQESANQMAAAQGAEGQQQAVLQGAMNARNRKQDIIETQFGMAQERLGAAKEARATATKQLTEGIGNVVGAAGEALAGGGFAGGAADFISKIGG